MFGNPMYYNNYPNGTFSNQNISQSFLNRLTNHHKINWSNLLNNTQKTLNVINQAIPIYKQVKPMIGNAKTMFKVMSAVRNSDNKTVTNNNTQVKKQTKLSSDGDPTFFI